MVHDGLLKNVKEGSAWEAFVVPKKDGRIRWVSNFCKLNEMIRQEPYSLPKIQDIMNWRGQYKFFMKIDLSMLY